MKFRKKPVVIDAIQYTGNHREIWTFMGIPQADQAVMQAQQYIPNYLIRTLEGEMAASPGDWIIKGVNSEFYPCKPDIFDKTYEEV